MTPWQFTASGDWQREHKCRHLKIKRSIIRPACLKDAQFGFAPEEWAADAVELSGDPIPRDFFPICAEDVLLVAM